MIQKFPMFARATADVPKSRIAPADGFHETFICREVKLTAFRWNVAPCKFVLARPYQKQLNDSPRILGRDIPVFCQFCLWLDREWKTMNNDPTQGFAHPPAADFASPWATIRRL
ncbi:MAG: hypothetical protein HZA50_09875 [Planctomycetes bacterium]|nr:hypothetical protein [Planctomycetota bacterium]